jgi:AcrR family transcriptional regulator
MTSLADDPTEQPRGLRERQRMQREEAILAAAFVLIVENGYEVMTMDDLAERVGISKPTLYNHFPSKEAIAVRALVELNDAWVRAIHAIDAGLPPFERLEQMLRWMVRNRFSPTPAAFLRARPALTPAKSHPDYLRAAARRIDAVADIVEAAQKSGGVDVAMPAKLVAQMLFNVVCTPEYDNLVARGEATPADIEETLLTMVFSGIRRSR